MRDHQHRVPGHDQAVAALFAWQLADPEDRAEFARNDDYVRDLAAEAAPFFGELYLEQLLAELASGSDTAAGWADWRALCEQRAIEVLHGWTPQLRPPAGHAPAA